MSTTDMNIDLGELIRETKDNNEYSAAVISVFQEVLSDSTVDSKGKAASIIDGLLRLWKSQEDEKAKRNFMFEYWGTVFGDLTSAYPPGHPWQQVLVDIVAGLRERGNSDANLAVWRDFKDLNMLFAECLPGMLPRKLFHLIHKSNVTLFPVNGRKRWA